MGCGHTLLTRLFQLRGFVPRQQVAIDERYAFLGRQLAHGIQRAAQLRAQPRQMIRGQRASRRKLFHFPQRRIETLGRLAGPGIDAVRT